MTAHEAIARSLAGVLGEDCRSVILHGSLAAGGFRPGTSDIDMLAVVDHPLTDGRADAIVALLLDAALGDATGVELDVITARTARSPTPAPPLELHVGRYPAEVEVERRVPAAPDLPAELSMARQDGRALAGADTEQMLAPIPPEWVVARGRHWLRTWQGLTDDTDHAAFMVLTACRIWRFTAEHVHYPKTVAARWALTQDPSLSAVGQALRQYEGDTSAVVSVPGIADVLARALSVGSAS
uniref:aminoglycoside adenylyltransferase domain-containing protein n=1 Tax=Paractinoplanes polyasparticus TaxID=2856853 RepID=UPI001C843A55|nr:aminoglycoside adenylyltransferase domain-containing protein [Actinoplanes polyasparticus]